MNKELELIGKKLLVLGGSAMSIDIVKMAHSMGAYVIVTDWYDTHRSPAKLIADESWGISIMDYDSLEKKIKEERIDGIFTSFTDSYLIPYVNICERVGLPYYASREAFEKAIDKAKFKNLCRKFDVPTVPEWTIEEFDPSSLSKDNAVIIKPVDNSGARGITYCDSPISYPEAIEHALNYSPTKHVIIEKYIRNGGTSMSVRYIAIDGELYLQTVGDRYVLDDTDGKALITAAAFYPSKHTDYYIQTLDEKVKAMFKSVGVRNGVLFMESFWTPEGIMFYEMGLRLSGGQTYNMTEIATGANELRMMVRFVLTGKMCGEDEKKKIDPYLNSYMLGSATVPLRPGTISSIEGIKEIKALNNVYSLNLLKQVGDTILPEDSGTLLQLLCRISIVAENKEQMEEVINFILSHLSVKDVHGHEMFIASKLKSVYQDYNN